MYNVAGVGYVGGVRGVAGVAVWRDGGGWSPVVTRNPIVMHRTREGLGGGEREEKLGPLNLNSICVYNRFSSTLPATTCGHYMRG